jgi:3D (Asp-Asp-Asp) domain-containing protein
LQGSHAVIRGGKRLKETGVDFISYLFWGGLVLALSAGMLLALSNSMAKVQAIFKSAHLRKYLSTGASVLAGVIILSAGLAAGKAFLPYAPPPQRVADRVRPDQASGEGTPPFGRWDEKSLPAGAKQDFSAHMVGIGSWYGHKFEGRRTASGEIFRSQELTLASRVIPLGSYVEITNLDNGQRLTARVNDRGPFIPGRKFDVSLGVAQKLAFQREGLANLRVRVLKPPSEGISGVR